MITLIYAHLWPVLLILFTIALIAYTCKCYLSKDFNKKTKEFAEDNCGLVIIWAIFLLMILITSVATFLAHYNLY